MDAHVTLGCPLQEPEKIATPSAAAARLQRILGGQTGTMTFEDNAASLV